MKFEHYLKKLHESQEYKKFRRKYKNEYMCAGFFVLDYEGGKDIHQIDYMLPNGKIATFFLDGNVKVKISEQIIKKDLPKLKPEIKTDLEALKGIVEDEMKNRTVTEKIRKIVAILHIMDNKLVWNLQCILDGLIILQVHVDDADKTLLKFEKHSLMEFIKSAPTFSIPKEETSKSKDFDGDQKSVISDIKNKTALKEDKNQLKDKK